MHLGYHAHSSITHNLQALVANYVPVHTRHLRQNRFRSALMSSSDGDSVLSPEALTNTSNQHTATIASIGTELGNVMLQTT